MGSDESRGLRNMALKIAVALVILFSLIMSVSATILNINSTMPISSIYYTQDMSTLGANCSSSNTSSSSNITSNNTVISNFTSIGNNCYYSCLLGADNTSYASSGSVNSTGVFYVNQTLNTNLSYGSHFLQLNCTYTVVSNSTTTTVAQYYNSTSNQTTNSTSTSSSSATRIYSSYENSTTIVDNTSASITLISPLNSSFMLQNNTGYMSVIFSFNATGISPMNCTIYYAVIGTNATWQLQANASPNNASNSTGVYITSQNITQGNYSYNVSCTDNFGNTGVASSYFSIAANTSALFAPYFNISIAKSSFSLGEIGYYTINAPSNSNVTITICPISNGWVQCYLAPTFTNTTFPITQALPYTNRTGSYIIEGVMNYGNTTLPYNTTYSTINTMSASIYASETTGGVGDIVTFNATAVGGVGAYTYLWTFDDGSTLSGPGAFRNYTSPGTYNVSLYANDSQGNNYTTSISVNILNYYNLDIIVEDSKSGSPIQAADVNAGGTDTLTDGSGAASFRLVSGIYDVFASKDGYGSYVSHITLNQDQTVYMNITSILIYPPSIDLITADNLAMLKSSAALQFEANATLNVSCSLYIANGSDSWFTMKDSGTNLLPNTEYTFDVSDLSVGSYRWKIECSDSNTTVYSSEESFSIVDSLSAVSSSPQDRDAYIINNALDRMNNLSGDESQAAIALGIGQSLTHLINKINNLPKDLNDVSFRRDLNDTGKAELRQNITDTVAYLMNSTPVNVQVTGSKTFVKYVTDQTIKQVISEYTKIKSLNVDQNVFLASTKAAQSDAVISTKVMNVMLYYLNGSTQGITLVIKTVQPDSPSIASSSSISFVEVIPKDIAQNISDVTLLGSGYNVISEDPLIEYTPDTTTISYYFDSTLNLTDMEGLDTVIIDKNLGSAPQATGFAILGIGGISSLQISGQSIMITIIALLLLAYFVMHFEILEKFRGFGIGSKKKVTYMRVLINDALDYLEGGDYDKAAYVYREIKLTYENSNEFVRKSIYDESFDLCNRLDMDYAQYLFDKIDSRIAEQNRNAAFQEFEKLEKTFSKLDDKYKGTMSEKFRTLLDRIKRVNG